MSKSVALRLFRWHFWFADDTFPFLSPTLWSFGMGIEGYIGLPIAQPPVSALLVKLRALLCFSNDAL